MNLNSIPAFDDNYIWVLNDEAGRCLIVDPGASYLITYIHEHNIPMYRQVTHLTF